MHGYFIAQPPPTPSGNDFISVIDHWQVLIGSLLGALIAIAGSLVIIRLQKRNEDHEEWKESLRTIEISLSRSLGDAINTREQLRHTVTLLRVTIADIKANPPNSYAIQGMNFPITGEIFRNEKLPEFKTKSSYLHNKLLISDGLLKITNAVVVNLKKDFETLLKRNEFIITLDVRGKTPTPSRQRDVYAQSLTSFVEAVDTYTEKELPKMFVVLDQARIYGRKLRKDPKATKRKYEFEADSGEEEKATNLLTNVDRIDAEIGPEVESDLKMAEDRLAKEPKE